MAAPCEVIYDFQSTNDDEMTVAVGELVTVLNEETEGWVYCRSDRTGVEGLVPRTYIKPMVLKSAPPRPPVSNQPQARPQTAVAQAPPPAAVRPQIQNPPAMAYNGAVDRSSINYAENLENWRERERKFKHGEQEKLPKVKQREYYYWDEKGKRQGPFSEAEMKARFDKRQVAFETMITPFTTPTATEALPKMSIGDYFPEPSLAFATAPVAPIENHLWLYLDDKRQVQGPFDANQMREWFLQDFFSAETRVRLSHRRDIGFAPLGLLFGTDGVSSFLSDGDQDAATTYSRRAQAAQQQQQEQLQQQQQLKMMQQQQHQQQQQSSGYPAVPPATRGVPQALSSGQQNSQSSSQYMVPQALSYQQQQQPPPPAIGQQQSYQQPPPATYGQGGNSGQQQTNAYGQAPQNQSYGQNQQGNMQQQQPVYQQQQQQPVYQQQPMYQQQPVYQQQPMATTTYVQQPIMQPSVVYVEQPMMVPPVIVQPGYGMGPGIVEVDVIGGGMGMGMGMGMGVGMGVGLGMEMGMMERGMGMGYRW